MPAPAAVKDMEDNPAVRVKALYNIMTSIENRLGGGEGVEGLYGSVNRSGMHKVLDCFRGKCGLDASSRLVDIGAGLGRPLLHALIEPGIASAFGVEIDRIKVDKADAFLRQTLAEMRRRGLASAAVAAPKIQCSPVEQVRTLDPCTHAYSFWEGVPVDGKEAFGALFAASRTLRSVAVVQRAMRGVAPAEVMAELGFGRLTLAATFAVSMSGSGRSFTAYVFNRAEAPRRLSLPAAALAAAPEAVRTPAQSQEDPAAALSQGGGTDDSELQFPAGDGGAAEQDATASAREEVVVSAAGRPMRSGVQAAAAARARGGRPEVVRASERPARKQAAKAPPAAAAKPAARPAPKAAAAKKAGAAPAAAAANGKGELKIASPAAKGGVRKAASPKAKAQPGAAAAGSLLRGLRRQRVVSHPAALILKIVGSADAAPPAAAGRAVRRLGLAA